MEHGRYKHISNRIRNLAITADFFEPFGNVLPVIGDLGVEFSAAAMTAIACAIDAAGCRKDGDEAGRRREIYEGVAETIAVGLPYLQYLKLFGWDIRDKAREIGAKMHDRKYGSQSFPRGGNPRPF